VREPNGLSNHSPTLVISWDPAALHVTGEEIAEEVATTKPRIALSGGAEGGRGGRNAAANNSSMTSISITPWQMQPGEDRIVADRLHALLSEKRSPKPSIPAAAGNLSGRWEVNLEYFSSKSRHSFVLMQEGNRLSGSHQGDFSTRDVFGTIEGDQVKLRSQVNAPGDSVPFIFAGSLAGDTMSGNVYMGEYLNAKFSAKRNPFPANTSTIRVPNGPPLAN
jgi:hypothetical protein